MTTDNPPPRVARGTRPTFHGSADTDHLFAMVTALTSEIAVLRERLDSHERLAEARAVFSRKDVEQLELDAPALAERTQHRQALIGRVFRSLAPAPVGQAYETEVRDIETQPGAATAAKKDEVSK